MRKRGNIERWTSILCSLIVAVLLQGTVRVEADPSFQVNVVGVRPDANQSGTRVDILTGVPYTMMQFIASGNGFEARYNVLARFYAVNDAGKRGNLVENHSWSRTVLASAYGATQADGALDRSTESVLLPPGRYLLRLRLEDRSTRKSTEQELAVFVRDLSRPLAISDLLLIDAYDAVSQAITPVVSTTLPTTRSGFKLFYELYAASPTKVRLQTEVYRIRGGGGPRSIRATFGLLDDEEPGDLTYTDYAPKPLKAGRSPHVLDIPMGKLRAGDYLVRISVQTEDGRVVDTADRVITAVWAGLEEHIQNIDSAIAQLAYIAKGKELDAMRSGATQSEKLARFRAFWKKRDPTPGTERNERMEEYYYRIANANQQYGALAAGWSTDRGHVMVLFGEPDRVDRHQQNYDVKPYEVWYYDGIRRQFIFIDNEGKGDYRLMEPVWDERSRLR